jgi:hypothetical protein
MEMLSREYGWTPEQIRHQSADDIDAYVAILMERANIAKHKQLKNKPHG